MKTREMNDWIKAGTYYRNKGNYEKALESFAQARLALLCELGECLSHLGRLDEGKALFEETLESNSADMRANAGMGIIYLLTGDHDSASIAFGNVLHLDPCNAKALCGLGFARKAAGDKEGAYDYFMSALEQDPRQKTALQALAELACDINRLEEVLPLLRKYLKLYPDDAEIATDLALLEGTAAQKPEISPVEELKQALDAYRSASDDVTVVNQLLASLLRLEKHPEALQVKQVYLQKHPDKESVLLQF